MLNYNPACPFQFSPSVQANYFTEKNNSWYLTTGLIFDGRLNGINQTLGLQFKNITNEQLELEIICFNVAFGALFYIHDEAANIASQCYSIQLLPNEVRLVFIKMRDSCSNSLIRLYESVNNIFQITVIKNGKLEIYSANLFKISNNNPTNQYNCHTVVSDEPFIKIVNNTNQFSMEAIDPIVIDIEDENLTDILQDLGKENFDPKVDNQLTNESIEEFCKESCELLKSEGRIF